MSWPPNPGEIWVAADRWPSSSGKPPINKGDIVLVVKRNHSTDVGIDPKLTWFVGEVLAPGGLRTVRALEGDLIPVDDP